jgi:subtilisin family serine protease
VVAAAGNDVGLVVYPARYAQTIAVAASNFDDQPWPKSSRGKTVDISAPGQDVWHAEPDPAGVLDTAGSGTSYSTATLAGVAALWLAFHERTALQAQLAPGQMLQEAFRSVLKHTARIPPGGWDQQHFGWGIVDAFEALNLGVSQIPSLFAGGAPTAPDPAQEVLETAVDADPETSKAVFGKTLEGGVLPPDEMLAAFSLELIRAIMEDGRLRELLERASTGQIRIGEAARMARVLLEPRVSRTFQHAAGWALER